MRHFWVPCSKIELSEQVYCFSESMKENAAARGWLYLLQAKDAASGSRQRKRAERCARSMVWIEIITI